MAIFSGKMSFRRYAIVGGRPLTSGEIEESLNRWRFSEQMEVGGIRAGWVLQDNLLDDDFSEDINRWSLPDGWAWFSYRRDVRSAPSGLLKATVDQRVRAWCKENDRERCPRAVKAELRELAEHELSRRSLPKTTLADVAWNLQTGMICFGRPTGTQNEAFRKLFQQTFGLVPVVWNPLMGLPRDLAMAFYDQPWSRTMAGMFDREIVFPEELPVATYDSSMVNLSRPLMDDVERWLLWLAWCGQQDRRVDDLVVTLDDRLVLQRYGGEGSGKASMSGPDVAGFPGIETAIVAGANPCELRLYVAREGEGDDSGWFVGLRGEFADTVRTGPETAWDIDGESAAFEHMMMLQESVDLTDRLFAAWVRALVAPTWPETELAMRAFAADGDAEE